MYHSIQISKTDLVIINKEKKICQRMNITISLDYKVILKENRKSGENVCEKHMNLLLKKDSTNLICMGDKQGRIPCCPKTRKKSSRKPQVYLIKTYGKTRISGTMYFGQMNPK